jgi:hypothetical protein
MRAEAVPQPKAPEVAEPMTSTIGEVVDPTPGNRNSLAQDRDWRSILEDWEWDDLHARVQRLGVHPSSIFGRAS